MMNRVLFKIGLFVCVWYEVSVELGLGGDTAFIVTLLGIGGALMLLKLPLQIMSALGPRVIGLLSPAAVWLGLAWWLAPGVVSSSLVLSLMGGTLLVVVGAAMRYVAARYGRKIEAARPAAKSLAVPLACVALSLFASGAITVFGLAALALLIALPLRLGWQVIGPVTPDRFEARMGSRDWFRNAGMSDEL